MKARLMEILRNRNFPKLDGDPIENLADYLIANGVCVIQAAPQDATQNVVHSEPQKGE